MKSTKALTHSGVLSAKPKEKPYKLSDTDRLYLLVTVAGNKYWKWNYRLDAKDSTYAIGTFPEVGLAEARDKRNAVRKLVEQGIDPTKHDDQQRHKAKADSAATFWSVCREWIESNRVKWSPSYAKQVESVMRRYIGDTTLGSRPIRQISTGDIYQLLASVAKRTDRHGVERKASGAPTVAINLRQWCGAVFRLAVISERADRNPVADLKASDVIVRPKVKNNRALKPTELKLLIQALRKFSGQRTTAIAIELLLLTFVRTVELRAATWDEFDLDKGIWTIPAIRMKNKKAGDHIVPLSAQAIVLLKELRSINPASESDRSLLLPNVRRASACMSATTVNRALERMGFNGKDTIGFAAHGFRGTASTLLHELGFRPEIIETQLAHSERNSTKAAYNKARYITERIAMMQRWSDFIDGLESNGKVIPIKTVTAYAGDIDARYKLA
jgi:integrase